MNLWRNLLTATLCPLVIGVGAASCAPVADDEQPAETPTGSTQSAVIQCFPEVNASGTVGFAKPSYVQISSILADGSSVLKVEWVDKRTNAVFRSSINLGVGVTATGSFGTAWVPHYITGFSALDPTHTQLLLSGYRWNGGSYSTAVTGTITFSGATLASVNAANLGTVTALWGQKNRLWFGGTRANANLDMASTCTTFTASEKGTGGLITLSATVGGSAEIVKFYIDDKYVGSSSAKPYSIQYDSHLLTDGVHSLTVTATDISGQEGHTDPLAFTIANAAHPGPTVTAAASGSAGTIGLSATATGPDAVTAVDFLIDGKPVGSDTGSPYALPFDTVPSATSAGLTDGTHSLVAQATDSAGVTNASAVVTFAVANSKPVATAAAAGQDHTCARLADGSVKCWGKNDYGQLGDGTLTSSSVPVKVGGLATAVAVANGSAHSCALLAAGTVQCWGRNQLGQLGSGTLTDSRTPVTVSGITTATSLAAGDNFTCARLTEGPVKCWGQNVSGQLGNGTTTSSSTPVTVGGITTATSVVSGTSHSCALLAGGTVQCWGTNASGWLGNGTTSNFSATPVAVSGITTAVAVAGGATHTCAVLAAGTVQCWGANGSGQLGNGTVTSASTPVTVGGITTAKSVAAGSQAHTCVVLADGSMKCWGNNSAGQLGNGTATRSLIPVPVSDVSTATVVTAGSSRTCAVLSAGSVKCWGANDLGQLGNGTNTNSSVPVTVTGIP